MSEPHQAPWYSESKKYRSKPHPLPLGTLPEDLDETGERLNADIGECGRRRAIAEDKITNPRHILLLQPVYMALRNAANAVRDRCDRIKIKIQIHRRVKRDKAVLPKPNDDAVLRYMAAARLAIKSRGETADEFTQMRAAVAATRQEAITAH